MKPPIDTINHSLVEYPSAVYSLERHEIYPYERFAYNTLRIGVEALHKKNLPASLYLSFTEGTKNNSWWYFNAGISPINFPSGKTFGFQITTSPMTPIILFGLIKSIGIPLFNNLTTYVSEPIKFKELLTSFGIDFSNAIKDYSHKGLATVIRKFYTSQKIDLNDIYDLTNHYDICSKFIANHEIAHAYVGQLKTSMRRLSASESRAFEYIVDIIGIEWNYNHLIVNTPDTKEYRKLQDAESYSECIYNNAIRSIQSQMIILIVFAFASVLTSGGAVNLDGGKIHPNSFFRYFMQNIHFTTLLASNYDHVLSKDQIKSIDSYSFSIILIFIELGIVTLNDFLLLKDSEYLSDFSHAFDLIDEFDINELKKSREIFNLVLDIIKDQKSEMGFNFTKFI